MFVDSGQSMWTEYGYGLLTIIVIIIINNIMNINIRIIINIRMVHMAFFESEKTTTNY